MILIWILKEFSLSINLENIGIAFMFQNTLDKNVLWGQNIILRCSYLTDTT